MILITACFSVESRWISRQPGVRVVHTAIGEQARQTMDELGSASSNVSLLLSTGFCGGIHPDIEKGTLFLATAIRHNDEEIRVSPEILEQVHRTLNSGSGDVHLGLCESVDHVLSSSEKRALAARGALVTDMESGPLARWAADREIPFLTLRIVLDPVEEDLPFAANRPFWLSAVSHPILAARVTHDAIASGRALGEAIDKAIAALLGRSNA